MNSGRRIAHLIDHEGMKRYHDLKSHLHGTADRTAAFASIFRARDWGIVAGLLHDIGKYQQDFQNYLLSGTGKRGDVPHAPAGAWFACLRKWTPIAFSIQGHHGGLPDALRFQEEAWQVKARRSMEAALENGWDSGGLPETLDLPEWLSNMPSERKRLAAEAFTRFLFSCLVDADYLDTEQFMNPDHTNLREIPYADLDTLEASLDAYMEDLIHFSKPGLVNDCRREILELCRKASILPPGAFSLAVPTGGGKTLSSMAFALRHAMLHGLHRIIVAIPFTSIIEQNAERYRDVFGKENIIEHHASIDPETETERNRLAAENWDAPIIVTTNVQFLESLFANRPGRCRKIHNIARSVIIFDEAQTIPPGLLTPTLSMLKDLVDWFGCSFVCCTATQPALHKRTGSMGTVFPGFEEMNPIIINPERFYNKLSRVQVRWPEDLNLSQSWNDLANAIMQEQRVLAIVNRRDDARELAKCMTPNTFHLSALMVPIHRLKVLSEIHRHLKDPDAICRVVATSLVEAGVDLDFPVVYRAFGPLDAIAQAAGRCNREGLLKDHHGNNVKGRVNIFFPSSKPLPGVHRRGTETTRAMYSARMTNLDDPDIYLEYFKRLYDTSDWDIHGIQPDRSSFKFRDVSKKYHLIDDGWSCPVIIPYDEKARETISRIRDGEFDKHLFRTLQRYVVNIKVDRQREWLDTGVLEFLIDETDSGDAERYPVVLRQPFFNSLYDQRFGLKVNEDPRLSAEELII